MDRASLEAVVEYAYGTRGWVGSLSSLMVHLALTDGAAPAKMSVFDHIQIGFGLLLTQAGVTMRDLSHRFRTPYWDHREILDWSGGCGGGGGTTPRARGGGAAAGWQPPAGSCVPIMAQALFAPVQSIFSKRVRVCCGRTEASCRDRATTCVVADWRVGVDCCDSLTVPLRPRAQRQSERAADGARSVE
jgi:hypothetical protein